MRSRAATRSHVTAVATAASMGSARLIPIHTNPTAAKPIPPAQGRARKLRSHVSAAITALRPCCHTGPALAKPAICISAAW